MASQPASAHLPTRIVTTGASTTAVVSQNFLRATARSKTSLTQIDSLRASYPLKLLSPASANTNFLELESSSSSTLGTKDENSSQPPSTITSRLSKLPPPPRIVYMITYGGGLLADDHPDLQLVLQRHAKLLVLGQGNTKIYKSPRPDYPPASQTLHSTVAPGALLLFLGPAVVACEDSSVFLRHEILLQAQRHRRIEPHMVGEEPNDDDELPNCVVLDWIAGGRGEEERWKARRSEWRLIVRWAELEPDVTPGGSSIPASQNDAQNSIVDTAKVEEEDEEYIEEEDPRDIADRLAGGPIIFRDGFLIEHNPPLPSKSSSSATSATTGSQPAPSSAPVSGSTSSPAPSPTPRPKMTSYAPSLYPHSTIGSLFIMGPKTKRLHQSILKRFEQLTIYPGQKPEQRADFPILWSVTVVQVPRPSEPNQRTPSLSSPSVPKRKRTKMNAMVVKMASQGIEQMQDFLKSLFEEQAGEMDNRKKMMDSSDDEEEAGGNKSKTRTRNQQEEGTKKEVEGLTVIDELFGGKTVWERVFR
ncbi:hypothetical protein BGZ80_003455 [Entomortierella chlamydospora]|uniref:Urease accessory protein n=1 Tax=Entomortierella chlamydospora TaxID=101097 RepID=A0A9P6SWY2_9FUNG|nr:hypothetical protein BGZ79_002487 [Entomortierella chlamydospora]KAG0008427.1 hypothetical protein BGZ80_003455 [Entomortierella chlamydospora]